MRPFKGHPTCIVGGIGEQDWQDTETVRQQRARHPSSVSREASFASGFERFTLHELQGRMLSVL